MNTHKELLSECCSAKPCGEIAYDNSGRCGDCKEGCMFTEECDTSCGINADPADGFGKCTCGAELAEPTPPSQIEEDPKIVQIAPVFTDKFNYLFGLGADGKPYYWDAKEEYWRYYDDQYGRHLDWELEQKFKEVNNTK